MKKDILALVFIIVALLICSVSVTHARIPENISDLKKAIVTIYIDDKYGNAIVTGSGFIVKSEGIVATSYELVSHWLTSESSVTIKTDENVFYSVNNLFAFDEEKNIALLSIQGDALPITKLARNYSVTPGEDIMVIGNPSGYETIILEGTIIDSDDDESIFTTAKATQGFSGAPVVNTRGEVIGIALLHERDTQKTIRASAVRFITPLLQRNKPEIPEKTVERLPVPSVLPSAPSVRSTGVKDLAKAESYARRNPGNAEAHYALGMTYYDSGRYQEAIGALQKAVEINPDHAKAYLGLGIIHGVMGKYRDAIKAFTKALQIRPDYAEAHNNLGFAYSILGMDWKAIESYKQALEFRPDYAEAYNNLGFSYGRSGMYEEEIEAYKQALAIKPDYAKALYNLGRAYGKSEDYPEAISVLKKAIRIKPDYVMAYFNLGVVYGRSGMHEEEIKVYRQALEIKPDYARARFNLGLAYAAINDRASALEEYNTLKELDPALAEALFERVFR